MELALIHPFTDMTVHGLRVLRALLKQRGHRVHLIHMPDRVGDEASIEVVAPDRRYPRRLLDDLCEAVADCPVVGLSVMTNYYDAAREITRAVKAEFPEKLVVWGGIHTMVRPEECLRHADLLIVGEAEVSLPEFVEHVEKGEDWTGVPGLAFLRDGELQRMPPPPLVNDLDSLPLPDMDLPDQWYAHEGRLRQVDDALLVRMLAQGTVSSAFERVGYQTMTSRGCPHACTYCVNPLYRKHYEGRWRVRYRSPESIIGELVGALRRFPAIDYIWFSDDTFFGRKTADVQRFAELYAREVGLPFYLLVSPSTVNEAKYAAIVEAGVHTVQMGIESAAPEIQAIFNRGRLDNDRVMKAVKIIAAYSDRVEPPQYDFITHVPWEDDEMRRQTLRFIAGLPRPFRLQLFSLVPFPGTELYDRYMDEGLIEDERTQIYDRQYTLRDDHYFGLVLGLASKGRIPGWVITALADERLAPVINSPLARPFGNALRRSLKATRKLRDAANYSRRMSSFLDNAGTGDLLLSAFRR